MRMHGRCWRSCSKSLPVLRVYPQDLAVALGLFGGLIDDSGGGGWGSVTTSTLLSRGKTAPRTVIGSVSASEFLVSVSASLGFLVGLREEFLNNLPVVLIAIAETIEKRVDRMLALFVRLMEPALLLGLAGVVLFIFIALIVPMLRLSAAISG